jgi:deazaflavin-dependent oxidoreductase (nitroreductase family)
VPSFGKIALGVTGAAVGVAFALPPVRRQALRAGSRALDELAVRFDTDLTRSLILLTTEGRSSRIPRTVLLTGIRLGDDLWALPWSHKAGWLTNVRHNPSVVVDDRRRVHRATAHVVEGVEAEAVRRAFLDTLPGPLPAILGGPSGPLGPGLPAVRVVPRPA